MERECWLSPSVCSWDAPIFKEGYQGNNGLIWMVSQLCYSAKRPRASQIQGLTRDVPCCLETDHMASRYSGHGHPVTHSPRFLGSLMSCCLSKTWVL